MTVLWLTLVVFTAAALAGLWNTPKQPDLDWGCPHWMQTPILLRGRDGRLVCRDCL